VRKTKIRISALTQTEVDIIKRNANFNQDQEMIFDFLNQDRLLDFAIMDRVGVSNHKYYEIKGIVIEKVVKIAKENGFEMVLHC
jgi:hypothetical protein